MSMLVWLWLSALVIAIDQIAKYWAVHRLVLGEPYALTSFFNLTLSTNTGAAFGSLRNGGGWQIHFFAILSIIVVIMLLIWLARLPRKDQFRACAMSLIIGGAIGNLIDRVRLHYVIDFFDFHIRQWHYATFNVADSAICVGAVLWIIHTIVAKKRVH